MGADTNTLKRWGRNIADRRQRLNSRGRPLQSGADDVLSRARLGQLLKPPVAEQTVGRWENGKMEPRRHQKLQLARVLRCEPHELFPFPTTARK